MSKLITVSRLTRFWAKAKEYIDNGLGGKAASDHMHDYGELMGLPTIPTTVAQLSDAGNYALKSDMANVYKYKGSKATVADLPTSATAGDVYNVEADGMNYAWDGSKWDNLGSIFEVATEAEVDAIFA